MKAMSNAVSLSLPRHCTQGSFANVVMPEKIESAVTRKIAVMVRLYHKETC
jgi:hypothetical protein